MNEKNKKELRDLRRQFSERVNEIKVFEVESKKAGNMALTENTLVRETTRCGVIESLVVNEATQAIHEGKEYNPDLYLANAIMYITITEALNELDLINADEQFYGNIIEMANGKNKEFEIARIEARGAKDIKKDTDALNRIAKARNAALEKEKK